MPTSLPQPPRKALFRTLLCAAFALTFVAAHLATSVAFSAAAHAQGNGGGGNGGGGNGGGGNGGGGNGGGGNGGGGNGGGNGGNGGGNGGSGGGSGGGGNSGGSSGGGNAGGSNAGGNSGANGGGSNAGGSSGSAGSTGAANSASNSAASSAPGGEVVDPDTVMSLHETGQIKSLADAYAAAQTQIQGDVIGAKLIASTVPGTMTKWTYDVRVWTDDGRVRSVMLDASTLAVVSLDGHPIE